MELTGHIKQLIAEHDYVVIPEFGGFIGKYAPSSIHPGNHEFRPPYKSLAFNRNLTNDDGLLIHHLVTSENLDKENARIAVLDFSRKLNAELNDNGVVTLDGIGRIFKDLEDRVRYKQDEDTNLLALSYGLPVFKSDPILRKKLVDTGSAIQTQEDSKTDKKAIPVWLWAAAAIFIGLLVILGSYFTIPGLQQKTRSLMGWNADSNKVELQVGTKASSSEIEWSFTNLQVTAQSGENLNAVPQDSIMEFALPEEVQKPYGVSVNSTIPKGYFIVVGSFANRDRAESLHDELSNEGRNAFLFPTAKNGFSRVAIFVSESNPYETSQILQDLRENYRSDAWVVRNK